MHGRWLNDVLMVALYFTLSTLYGCASLPDNYRDPKDPFESYNRAMYQFNSDFDKTILAPVARGYKAITPKPLKQGVTNFFANMRDVESALNNLLQLKLPRVASDLERVTINSTLGLAGLIDVASKLKLPSYKKDFGQTLGYWGVGPGPYIVTPILGPSDLRDSISMVPDWYSQPTSYLHDTTTIWGLSVLYAIDTRANLLDVSKALEEAALDPYTFTRDAYLQKRQNDIYDGNPPPEDEINSTTGDNADFPPNDESPKASSPKK